MSTICAATKAYEETIGVPVRHSILVHCLGMLKILKIGLARLMIRTSSGLLMSPSKTNNYSFGFIVTLAR